MGPAFDWRAGATYAADRLREPSTRLALGAVLSRLVGSHTPDDVAVGLEVLGYVLTFLVAAWPDRGRG